MMQELNYRKKEGPLLFIMILGAFIAVSNQTILSVAILKHITDLILRLQHMRHYSALDAGMLMLPCVLLMELMMLISGRMFDRFGAK